MLRLRHLHPRRALVAVFAAATLLLTSCDVSTACDPVRAEFHAPDHAGFVAAPHSPSRLLLQHNPRSLLRAQPFQAARALVDPPRRIEPAPLAASHLRLLPPARRRHGAAGSRTDDPPA